MNRSLLDVTGDIAFVTDHAPIDGSDMYPVDDVISDYDILDVSHSPVVAKLSSLNYRLTSATSTAMKSTSVATLIVVASLTCVVGVFYVVVYFRRLGREGFLPASSMRSRSVVNRRSGSRRGEYRRTRSPYVKHHSIDRRPDVRHQRYEQTVSTNMIIYASPMTRTYIADVEQDGGDGVRRMFGIVWTVNLPLSFRAILAIKYINSKNFQFINVFNGVSRESLAQSSKYIFSFYSVAFKNAC